MLLLPPLKPDSKQVSLLLPIAVSYHIPHSQLFFFFFFSFHPLCCQSYVSWVLGIRTVTAAGSALVLGTGNGCFYVFIIVFNFFIFIFIQRVCNMDENFWFWICASIYPIRSYTTSSFYSMISCHRYTIAFVCQRLNRWFHLLLFSLSLINFTLHNFFVLDFH